MVSRIQVILVIKKTRYETASEEARELLRRNDPSVSGWMPAHDRHYQSVNQVEEALAEAGVTVSRIRNPYDGFDSGWADLVVVVGGDGTFLAASHSVCTAPMLGVNSDPESSRGFFCGTTGEGFARELERFIGKESPTSVVQRMSVSVDGNYKSHRVLNEALTCHPHPAATSRFSVSFGTEETTRGWEAYMSSGIWVGPPAGTTGAIRSAGGDVLPLESKQLEFISRETIFGEFRKNVTSEPIRARVKTDVAAVYMDGPYRKSDLKLGQVVEFRLSSEPLTVVGLGSRR